jgi:hypothetical protein
MPWPAGLNQLRFVDSYGGFRERVVVRVTDRPDRRVNTRFDEMLSEPERRVLTARVRMVNELVLALFPLVSSLL